MTKVKIISNPYERNIEYLKFNENENKWDNFYDKEYTGGVLRDKRYIEDFFPFKAKDIIDAICRTLMTQNEQIYIEFEGTRDEYDILFDIINSPEFVNNIKLKEFGSRYLDDANIIKPKIRNIIPRFFAISDTINSFPAAMQDDLSSLGKEIETEIKKACDATEDIVPICVVGNYSSGKSTFINAIIGRAILPNGDQPLTALVYKISSSKNPNVAEVSYVINGELEKIEFCSDVAEIKNVASSSNLVTMIRTKLDNKDIDIFEKVRITLEMINKFANKDNETDISQNPICVTVPFGKGLLKQSANKYVIIDTPGGNASTKTDHKKVLMKSIENMTNGIPVFVTLRNTLSTIDNENFIKEITELDELDKRFTMIVVNRADDTRLPPLEKELLDEFKDDIRGEGVPMRLNNHWGIFFISSLVALGNKLDGRFCDEHYEDVYEKNIKNFSDPNDKHYKQLYRYNIMPEHIEKRALNDTKACDDIVFLNSGMYCIEKEVEYFSNRFASYNKCYQAYKHLDKAIERTDNYLHQAEKICSEEYEELKKQFESDKQNMKNTLYNLKEKIIIDTVFEYGSVIDYIKENNISSIEPETIELRFNQFFEKEKGENDYYSLKHKVENTKNQILAEFKQFRQKKKINNYMIASENYMNDEANVHENKKRLKELKALCEKNASEELLKELENECINSIYSINDLAEEKSKDYWRDKEKKIRQTFIETIVESDSFSPEIREELKHIVILFPECAPDITANILFDKNKLAQGIDFRIFVIGDKNLLNYKKVSIEYMKKQAEFIGYSNREGKAKVQQPEGCCDSVREKYNNAFAKWLDDLVGALDSKMVDLNMSLYKQSREIDALKENISILNAQKTELENCAENIKEMIDWKN